MAQKLLQETFSALCNSVSYHALCCQYRICGIWYNVLIRQGEHPDTTVLEIEMEKNINDQENRKMTLAVNDAGSSYSVAIVSIFSYEIDRGSFVPILRLRSHDAGTF